jgi:hypothetical protein
VAHVAGAVELGGRTDVVDVIPRTISKSIWEVSRTFPFVSEAFVLCVVVRSGN